MEDFEFIRSLGEGSKNIQFNRLMCNESVNITSKIFIYCLVYGVVYLVRLKGDPDGKLFALKASNIYWALYADRTKRGDFDCSDMTLERIINEFDVIFIFNTQYL